MLLTTHNTLPSSLIAGCATFGYVIYQEESVSEQTGYETIRAALSNGVTAIDTSPWYTPSEKIIGRALQRLHEEGFSRSSYQLMTKVGRYRPADQINGKENDFSAERVLQSVQNSLKLLNTEYLDVVYLHDVELRAECVGDANEAGFPSRALQYDRMQYGLPEEQEGTAWEQYGLAGEQEGKIWGSGDAEVLEGARVLFECKDMGIIKNVGMSGYPIITLLRLAILIKKHLGRPLDYLLSYGHHTLQAMEGGTSKTTLQRFASLLTKKAQVKQLVNASPFSMGLLVYGGPSWHPAPDDLKTLCRKMVEEDPDIVNTHLKFGIRPWKIEGSDISVPTVVGWINAKEVRESVKALEETKEDNLVLKDLEKEQQISSTFQQAGYGGWHWRSGTSATSPS